MAVDISRLMISIIISQVISIVGSVIYGKFSDSWFINLKKPKMMLPGPAMLIARVTIATVMGILFYIVWGSEYSPEKNVLMILLIALMFTGILSPYFLLIRKSPALSSITLVISLVIGIVSTALSYEISNTAAYLSASFVIWILYLIVITIDTAIVNKNRA